MIRADKRLEYYRCFGLVLYTYVHVFFYLWDLIESLSKRYLVWLYVRCVYTYIPCLLVKGTGVDGGINF